VIRTTVTLPSRRSGLAPGTAAVLGGVAVLLAVAVVLGWRALGNTHAGVAPPTRGTTLSVAPEAPASENARAAPKLPDAAPSPIAPVIAPPAAARPAPPANPPAAVAASEPGTLAASRPAVSSDRPAPPAGASVSSAPGIRVAPPDPSAQAAPGASPTTPAPPQSAGDQGGEHERSFRLSAVVDGVTLTLDYIAYQPSKAFAGINGKEVVVGTVIEGVRVEEIGPDYVRLRDRHGPFYLRTE